MGGSSSSRGALLDDAQFAVVIDGGSTGSRATVLKRVKSDRDRPIIRIGFDDSDPGSVISEYEPVSVGRAQFEEGALRVEPGLSHYAASGDMLGAASSLEPLITGAKDLIGNAADWANTDLYIYATAGVRLLDTSVADEMWTAVRGWSSNATLVPFRLVDARTLSGMEEALFGFLTANYDKGMFADLRHGRIGNAFAFLGTLDLGGVSAEISFLPRVPSLGNSNVEIFLASEGSIRPYHLYAHSYMRLGTRDAFFRFAELLANDFIETSPKPGSAKLLENPCLVRSDSHVLDLRPWGGSETTSFRGTGDFEACYAAIKSRILGVGDYGSCLFPPCAFNGVHTPNLTPDMHFVAFAGYFYTANALGLAPWSGEYNGDLERFRTQGAKWCSGALSPDAVDENDPEGAPYRKAHLQFYCFNSAYVYATLVDGYGFESKWPDDTGSQITFSKTFSGGKPASWAMGAVLHYEQTIPCRYERRDVEGDEITANISKKKYTIGEMFTVGFIALLLGIVLHMAYTASRRLSSSFHHPRNQRGAKGMQKFKVKRSGHGDFEMRQNGGGSSIGSSSVLASPAAVRSNRRRVASNFSDKGAERNSDDADESMRLLSSV